MENCIFCKIISGELPCTKVYEDRDTIVFMDIGPIVKGHALVVPKQHYADVIDTPTAVLTRMIVTAQKIAVAQKKAFQADGINIIQSSGRAAGQVVGHIHLHVIPRFLSDGHHWNWKAQKYADNSEMQSLADRIKSALA